MDFKELQKQIDSMVKDGRILVHQHTVNTDGGKTLLGSAPVYHAVDGDLEALALIHKAVGGSVFITKTVNAAFNGTVGTSARNHVDHEKNPCSFDDALKKRMGLTSAALYTSLKYGSFQESDSLLKEYNARLKGITTELSKAKVDRDKAGFVKLLTEQGEIEDLKRERQVELEFGAMD